MFVVTKEQVTLIQQAGENTSQTVLLHTQKYHDAYTIIDQIMDQFWQRLPYIAIATLVFIIFWFVTKLFKWFIRKTLDNRRYTRQNLVLVLNRVGSTLILFLGFLIALVIAIPGFTPGQLIGALGISSVAIGFAFKDIFQNLLSGILILLSEPFHIGDSIVVNSMEGTVEDIQVRATFLRSADGRRIVIPNATVYTSAIIVNTAYQHRRCNFSLNVHYQENIQQVKDLILDILNNHRNVLSQPAFSVNISVLTNNSIELNILWWIDTTATSISTSISEIQEAIVIAFEAQGITIPHPVQEVKIYRDHLFK